MKTKSFSLLTVLLAAVMLVALSLNVMAAKSNAVTVSGLAGCGQEASNHKESETKTNVEVSEKETPTPTEEPQEIVTVKWIARTDPRHFWD